MNLPLKLLTAHHVSQISDFLQLSVKYSIILLFFFFPFLCILWSFVLNSKALLSIKGKKSGLCLSMKNVIYDLPQGLVRMCRGLWNGTVVEFMTPVSMQICNESSESGLDHKHTQRALVEWPSSSPTIVSLEEQKMGKPSCNFKWHIQNSISSCCAWKHMNISSIHFP